VKLTTTTNVSVDGVMQGLGGPDAALDLVDSRSTPSGVSIQVYRPTGRPQYATATAG
jgi:hypothetical protein